MRYRTVEEILSTKPEDRVVEVFIETYGPVIGVPLAIEFSTNPVYKDQYEKMVQLELQHIEGIRKLTEPKAPKPRRFWQFWRRS